MANSLNDTHNNSSKGLKTNERPKPRSVFIRGKRPTSMTITYQDGSRLKINPTIEFLLTAWKAARYWSELAVGISEGKRFTKLQIQ